MKTKRERFDHERILEPGYLLRMMDKLSVHSINTYINRLSKEQRSQIDPNVIQKIREFNAKYQREHVSTKNKRTSIRHKTDEKPVDTSYATTVLSDTFINQMSFMYFDERDRGTRFSIPKNNKERIEFVNNLNKKELPFKRLKNNYYSVTNRIRRGHPVSDTSLEMWKIYKAWHDKYLNKKNT